MEENKAVKPSDSGDVSTVKGDKSMAELFRCKSYKTEIDCKSRKTAMPIPEVQLASKVKIALDTKETINKKRDIDGLLKNKPRNVVCLDKSVVSYEPKVETTSIIHKCDSKKPSPVDRALEIQANLASNFPSFVKIMLPSHVAGCFCLSLPKNFSVRHLPMHDDTVVLVDESGLEYETKYLLHKNGLSAGWRGFAIAHGLHEKDVLVFHMIQQCRFKVYIVRTNKLPEDDGATGLVNVAACVRDVESDHRYEDMQIIEITQDKQLEQYSSCHSVQERDPLVLSDDIDAAAHNTVIDVDDCSIEDSDGIRFSQLVVDFKDVKSFTNFNIIVNGLVIDSEIPQHLRVKYYELCCSQKSYLHDQLIDGLNLKLAVGVIFETINIADAIRSSKLATACSENLKIWDNTLKAFMDLGMKVGFLRARIDKLLTLSHSSKDAMKHKICEKVKAEEQLEALEMKIISVKDEIENLDSEIQAMKMKGESLEAEFKKEAKAPW